MNAPGSTLQTPGITQHIMGPMVKSTLTQAPIQRNGLDACKAGWTQSHLAPSTHGPETWRVPQGPTEVVGHNLPATNTMSPKAGCGGDCGCGGTCGKKSSCDCQHEVDYKIPGMGCACGTSTTPNAGTQHGTSQLQFASVPGESYSLTRHVMSALSAPALSLANNHATVGKPDDTITRPCKGEYPITEEGRVDPNWFLPDVDGVSETMLQQLVEGPERPDVVPQFGGKTASQKSQGMKGNPPTSQSDFSWKFQKFTPQPPPNVPMAIAAGVDLAATIVKGIRQYNMDTYMYQSALRKAQARCAAFCRTKVCEKAPTCTPNVRLWVMSFDWSYHMAWIDYHDYKNTKSREEMRKSGQPMFDTHRFDSYRPPPKYGGYQDPDGSLWIYTMFEGKCKCECEGESSITIAPTVSLSTVPSYLKVETRFNAFGEPYEVFRDDAIGATFKK